MGKFNIIGLQRPGRINAKIDGRFMDIDLYDAPDEVLEKLYADNCPYIAPTPEAVLKKNPGLKNIAVNPIKDKSKKR